MKFDPHSREELEKQLKSFHKSVGEMAQSNNEFVSSEDLRASMIGPGFRFGDRMKKSRKERALRRMERLLDHSKRKLPQVYEVDAHNENVVNWAHKETTEIDISNKIAIPSRNVHIDDREEFRKSGNETFMNHSSVSPRSRPKFHPTFMNLHGLTRRMQGHNSTLC